MSQNIYNLAYDVCLNENNMLYLGRRPPLTIYSVTITEYDIYHCARPAILLFCVNNCTYIYIESGSPFQNG